MEDNLSKDCMCLVESLRNKLDAIISATKEADGMLTDIELMLEASQSGALESIPSKAAPKQAEKEAAEQGMLLRQWINQIYKESRQ